MGVNVMSGASLYIEYYRTLWLLIDTCIIIMTYSISLTRYTMHYK